MDLGLMVRTVSGNMIPPITNIDCLVSFYRMVGAGHQADLHFE